MRASVASLSKKLLSAVFAALLAIGLVPAGALALSEGEAAAAEVGSSAEAAVVPGDDASTPQASSVEGESGVESAAAGSGTSDGEGAVEDAAQASNIVNQELPLETVAQAESTRSFFLAQTLESTRTVPMVSAKLPIDAGSDDGSEAEGEGGAGAAVAAESTVVGSFERLGMTFAIEEDGRSVALVAVDRSKLPEEFVEEQVLAIPELVTPDGIGSCSVARIANGAFAGMENAADGEAARAIEALAIPASVARIDDGALDGFAALQCIVVSPDNSEYSSYDGCLYDAAQQSLLLIPEGRAGAVRIAPSAVNVDPEVFSHCPSVDAVIADADGAAFASENGCLYSKDMSALIWAPSTDAEEGSAKAADGPEARNQSEMPTYDELMGRFEEGIQSELEMMTVSSYAATTGTIDVYGNGGQIGVNVGGNYLGSYDNWSHTWGVNWSVFNSTAQIHYYTTGGDLVILTISRPGFTFSSWGSSGDYMGYTDIRLGAIWDPNLYTITLNNQGATSAGSTSVNFYMAGAIPNITPPSKSNYTFGGYYTEPNGAGDMWINSSGQSVIGNCWHVGNVTLYARWIPNVFSIAYTLNGGAIAGQQTSYPVETADFTLVGPSRTGYEFVGWVISGASGTGIASNGSKNATVRKGTYGNLTAAAQWSKKTYSISYTLNGGTLSGEATSYDIETADFRLVAPVRAHYVFAGWEISGASGVGISSNGRVDATVKKGTYGNLVASAKWTPASYTITYEEGGGVFEGKTNDYTIESADFKLPSTGKRTGYTFAGWEVTGCSGSGVTGDGTTEVTVKTGTFGNLVAKAKWSLNTYHLSWDVPQGTHANRTGDFTVEDCPIAMGPASPDAGYVFAGWSGEGLSGSPLSSSLSASFLEGKADGATLSFAAAFKPASYAVRLHANDGTGDDGSGAIVERSVTFGDAVSAVEIPKRYGYAFSGFYAKGDDGSKGACYFDEHGAFVKGAVWEDTADVDLYASWILIGDFEVPVASPGSVGFALDMSTGNVGVPDDMPGEAVTGSIDGRLRSAMPQEVPIASIRLESLQEDGVLAIDEILGEGNAAACGMEVTFGLPGEAGAVALTRFATPVGSADDATLWQPDEGEAPMIPAALPATAGSAADALVSDSAGNLAEMGELSLSYAFKLLPGFDMAKVSLSNESKAVARVVFTVDLSGIEHEWF